MHSDHNLYVSDAPLSDPKHDRFHRLLFAERIAETIAGRLDPSSLVVAIYGAWGNGKTTVLNFVDYALRSHPNVIVFSFNPWKFPNERSLLQYFFTGLAKSLESQLTTGGEEIRKVLERYGGTVQRLCSRAGNTPEPPEEPFTVVDLDEEKRRIAAHVAASGKKIVVLIDDIDRLEVRAIQAVFRLVKLTADFQNTVYVLAFDAEMVTSVIGERFNTAGVQSLRAGQEFLEKIVQVPLDLPAVPSEALREFGLEAVNEALAVARVKITDAEAAQFVKHFHEGLEIRLTTPRMAKRWGNALAFSLAINKGEVNTVEMMLVEGIRLLYPSAYSLIKGNKDILVGPRTTSGVEHDERQQRVQHFLSAVMEGLTTREAAALRTLLAALFPRIIGQTKYGSEWEEEWGKTQRVTSEKYFDRYFSYAIPSRDLADEEVRSFVATLETASLDAAISSLTQLATSENVGLFITKASGMKADLSPRGAETLALAVSRMGTLFPNPKGLFLFTQPVAQAGRFVGELLERIPRYARLEVATRIAIEAEPIRFAIEAVKWISAANGPEVEDRRLTVDEEEKLWRQLVARIEGLTVQQAPRAFLLSGRDAASCLSVWAEHGDNARMREYLTQAIEANPQNAATLIEGFLPPAPADEGGQPGDLTRIIYETLRKIVDAEAVLRALQRATGESLQSPVYHSEFSRPLEIKIAHQFAFVHHAVLAER